jgi:lysozyme family protein
MTPEFKNCLEFTLKWEGGWSSHAKDPGLSTMRGITQNEYDRYRYAQDRTRQTVKLIAQDELEDMYYNGYWLTGKCDKLPMPLAMVHFDTVVKDGHELANKFLASSGHPKNHEACLKYIETRQRFYQDQAKEVHGNILYLRALNSRCIDLKKAIKL